MTKSTTTEREPLNTIESAKRLMYLRKRYKEVHTEEGKAELLAEFEDHDKTSWGIKVDNLYYARRDAQRCIEEWKNEELPKVQDALKHEVARLEDINNLIKLIHQLGACNADGELVGHNYTFKLYHHSLKMTVTTPIEEWSKEHQDKFAMVEEISSTTVLKKNGKPIGEPSTSIKSKFILDRNAIKACYESDPYLLPGGLKVEKTLVIKTKRKLSGDNHGSK